MKNEYGLFWLVGIIVVLFLACSAYKSGLDTGYKQGLKIGYQQGEYALYDKFFNH